VSSLSLLLRSVRLLVVLGCSIAVALVVGVAPASAVKVSEAENAKPKRTMSLLNITLKREKKAPKSARSEVSLGE
jgi:hypothetical protein